jgi:hypothetical protein
MTSDSKTSHSLVKSRESNGNRFRAGATISMCLQFHRAVENMDVWSASSADISFVITFASPTGSGFRGRHGFLASWRPLYSSTGAVKVIGSPFNTFEDAEGACRTMLGTLEWEQVTLLRQTAPRRCR